MPCFVRSGRITTLGFASQNNLRGLDGEIIFPFRMIITHRRSIALNGDEQSVTFEPAHLEVTAPRIVGIHFYLLLYQPLA